MLKVVHEENESHEKSTVCGGSLLDQVVRDGARQMLAVALQAEVAAYIEAHAHERDEAGLRWAGRGEVALHTVFRACCGLEGNRGPHPSGAPNTLQRSGSHQPLHGAARYRGALHGDLFTAQLVVNLPGPVARGTLRGQ